MVTEKERQLRCAVINKKKLLLLEKESEKRARQKNKGNRDSGTERGRNAVIVSG